MRVVQMSVPEIYIVGAFESNAQHGARGGIGVYWGPDNPRNVSERLKGDQTINRAAIRAAVRALGQARAENLREIRIFSDSEFLITSVNQGLGLWQRTGWTTVTGQPVENREDFEDLIIASTGIPAVHWRRVEDHSRNLDIEAADQLAREGLLKKLLP
uniref:RNase H type-1 domain-containing protein n=1 Tax=Strigamia maritima TaxID=126957 RepID=T1IKG5_STRMM